jgi:hypothetical protein
MGTELELAQQASEVSSWRRDQLVRAGFSLPAAARLASDARYDLHALLDLVARGCPAELAVRILAPLEESDAG